MDFRLNVTSKIISDVSTSAYGQYCHVQSIQIPNTATAVASSHLFSGKRKKKKKGKIYSEGTLQFLLASFFLECFSGFDNYLTNILLRTFFSACIHVISFQQAKH